MKPEEQMQSLVEQLALTMKKLSIANVKLKRMEDALDDIHELTYDNADYCTETGGNLEMQIQSAVLWAKGPGGDYVW